mmetsp:Transcript_19151/g.36666  ORF Transcript_19151/g.36666 Transcript_19151/m.36666 type:complete len:99 (-) Transcript_19151:330-626(-)|eukprot:CAMPEP_0114298378 /NCGR_PEP_ID=MMETSP0059-20121206/12386_1 /TAXON_ID=36894 /ORGANISM="Pyramimonas parkeae, Strain CCMP726" /LENGTH=98 /DNA_ID=CAMNT_0001420735 /DNA_START=53 /DNA_END=349 /DNA_ORIENTATION=-
MVCTKCEKKLAKLACPDKWKEGSSNAGSSRDTTGKNKAIGKKKVSSRYNPYCQVCKICKQNIHTGDGMYCQACAYKKGVCSLCGVQIMDTTFYKQSNV